MPTFKLNGNTYSGSTNYASAIEYIEKDGTKTTVQDKISELDGQNKNLGKDLLWKNNDTLSSSYNFPAQSIQIEGITNYSMVMIVFTLFVNSSGGYLPKHIVVDEGFYGKQCHAMHTQAGTDMSAVSWSRPFTINEHGVVFENAKVTTGTTEQSNSARWIPMSIYGIK